VSGDRELDVVVFGATGFVGRLVAGYLADHAPPGVRIGLAGRSEQRLADSRAGLGSAASSWPLLVADSADPASLAALARAARVVATTVGPYRRGGLALVEACASAGADYADLTGEVLFMRESIDRYHRVAAGTGARIVHSCGFDSIPSDLGVLLLHHAARADDAGDLEDTTLVVTALRGGVSGGTLASGIGQQDEMRAAVAARRLVADPYALSPDRGAEPDLGDQSDLQWARHDADLGIWVGPFVMAGLNTRVVRRSNALHDWAYGRRFRYREVTGFGSGPAAPVQATAMAAGVTALTAGLAFPPSRALLATVLPRPGQGPSDKIRRSGYFRIQIHTRTSAGVRYLGKIEARGDPGYAATSVMLGESALCLALDRDRLPDRAGVLTPATAMGATLAERLKAAGQTLTAQRITQLPAAAEALAVLLRAGLMHQRHEVVPVPERARVPVLDGCVVRGQRVVLRLPGLGAHLPVHLGARRHACRVLAAGPSRRYRRQRRAVWLHRQRRLTRVSLRAGSAHRGSRPRCGWVVCVGISRRRDHPCGWGLAERAGGRPLGR
jgi:short subunit dehydrogenase-like uncharacterized protein